MRARTGLIALLLILTLLTPAATAASQNDDGMGADAPDAWQDAINVTFAPIAGTLDPGSGDHADWYRVPFAAGKILEITYSTALFRSLVYIDDDAGNQIAAYDMQNWWGMNATWDPIYLFPHSDHLRIGFADAGYGGTYYLELRTRDYTDMALNDLTIARAPPPDPAVPAPSSSLSQLIIANVSNNGLEAGTAHVHASVMAMATREGRDLGTRDVALSPGGASTITFQWSGVGEVGEMQVQVHVSGRDVKCKCRFTSRPVGTTRGPTTRT